MCDFGHSNHDAEGFGFLVDNPEIRELIHETRRITQTIPADADRVEALRPAFSKLLSADGWLPDACSRPDLSSKMGGGVGQYALYRAQDGSLCLFSLVVPAGVSTPVHDHLAWGLVGIYRGMQNETVYQRLDNGDDPGHAELRFTKKQTLKVGELYALLSYPSSFLLLHWPRLRRRSLRRSRRPWIRRRSTFLSSRTITSFF